MIQEQQDVEHNLKINQPSSKAMSCISKASSIHLIALKMVSVAALLIFITTGMVFYNHHHRQLIGKSINKDLQSTTTTDLTTSFGPMVISTSSSANIPSTERRALQDLFECTDGAHWNYGSSSAGTHWSFDDHAVNPCTEGWYGVQCSNNRITGLILVGSNLIGTIPESLSQLTMLMYLDLGGNLLIGVPATLCQIESLVRVDLEGNGITCYPHCLDHATVEMKVHPSTPVCNNIPSSFSLSGPSKDASSSSLEMTSNYSNNISPEERQALQDLYDSIDGPNWYYYYGGTQWDFSNPNVNPCDEEWSGVTCSLDFRVNYLSLSNMNLRGTIPSTIGNLSSLQYLHLSNSQLTGSFPSTIVQLSSLYYLNLRGSKLIGTIPTTIGHLSSLQVLYLDDNQLTGTIPSNIGQLSSLQYLFLYDNQLIGSIPSTIGQLSSLQYLYLSFNQLIGTIPEAIGQLSSLQYLFLSYNQLIGSIPSTIGQLSSLQKLYLSRNQLIGTIPEAIGQLSSLQYLFLSYNQLIGSIPSTIGQLSSLQKLYLSRNQLTGTIPETIGQLSSLDDLFLESNRLNGTIPSTVGQLSSLIVLYLGYNRLIGTIPSTIGNLSSLEYLWLESNQLTGIMPSSLCRIKVFEFLSFGGNMLQCYPACLQYSKVYNLGVGSTPICDNPTAIPTHSPSTVVPTNLPTCSLSSSYDCNNISPLERQALQDLYNSTDGPNWYYYSGFDNPWDFSNPNVNPCDEGSYALLSIMSLILACNIVV
jgi:Leucine-rich repeat (LRR) protein